MARKNRGTDDVLKELRAFGLAYPGSHTKSPWPGHLDLAVKDKTFAYLSLEGEPLRISCKLPQSSGAALMLPFSKPTAYGLGKSGWVSAQFPDGEAPPKDLLKAWIDESYRSQAPKKLVATLTAVNPGEKKTAKTPTKKTATKKTAAKKTVTKKTANKTASSGRSKSVRASKTKRSARAR